jgi:hypothetical protein
MKERLKLLVAVLVFFTLLLSLAVLVCAIQGVEVEQVRELNNSHASGNNDAWHKYMTKVIIAVTLQCHLEAANLERVLNSYNSPLADYSMVFVRESHRTGIPAELPAAIAGKESYFGHQCFAPHNAYGMLSFPGGWATWEEGIRESFNWLQLYYGRPQSPHDCPGYCVPMSGWLHDVSAIMEMF